MEGAIKILCVEDDYDIRSNISEILRSEGYEVFEAENGELGFQKFLEVDPDLIISDVMMPDFDGFYLLSKIRSDESINNHLVPFIFLSALGQKEHIMRGLEFMANDYLTKPVDFDILISKVLEKTKNSALINRHYDRNISNIHRQISEVLPYELCSHLNIILQSLENIRTQPHGKLEENLLLDLEKIYLQAIKMKSAIYHNLDKKTIERRFSAREETLSLYEFFESTIADFGQISCKITLDKPYSEKEMPKIRIERKVFSLALFNLLSEIRSAQSVVGLKISFLIDHFEQLVVIFYLEPQELSFAKCINEKEIARILDSQNCKFELVNSHEHAAILTIPSYRISAAVS